MPKEAGDTAGRSDLTVPGVVGRPGALVPRPAASFDRRRWRRSRDRIARPGTESEMGKERDARAC